LLSILFILAIIIEIFILYKWLGRKRNLVGAIVVTEREDTTLFSLELDGDPKDIVSKKEVTFKILVPDVESDRE
jgi:hypothetical protein